MKKIFSLFLVFVLATLVGCTPLNSSKGGSQDNSSDIVSLESSSLASIPESQPDSSKKTETSSKSEPSSKPQSSQTSTDNQSSNKTTNSSSDTASNVETSSKVYVDTHTSSNPPVNTQTSSQKAENTETSSKAPTTTDPSVDNNPDNAPLDDTQNDVICYTYAINGTIIDWLVDSELVHAVFKQANRYAVFDTTTGKIVTDKALSGRPAKMRKYGDELWISYPDLKCIKIHDSKTFDVKNTLYFSNEVSSFDVYGDYLIYTEDDQHVNAYRYNMKTSESVRIKTENIYSFYEADVLVNSELGYVYIGESASSGSVLYCFDIETLTLVTKYCKDEYGYNNKNRRTFLLGDFVYWGEFKLNAKNISQLDGQYTGQYPSGMLHVDETFVATSNGIYLTSTFEQLASGLFNGYDSSIAITKSGNILITEQQKLYIFSQKK